MATLAEVIDELKQGTDATHDVAHEVSQLNASFNAFFKDSKGKKLDDLEKEREQKQGRGVRPQTPTRAGGSGAGGGGPLSRLLGGFGLGGAGIGIGAAGAGLGAFFMGLAGAESIMAKFGSGDNLKNLLTNLAEGLSAFSTRDLTALGALLGAGALFGAVPGLSGVGAGIGIGAMGVGIAAFFAAFAAGDKSIEFMQASGESIKKIIISFADSLGALTNDNLDKVGKLFLTSAAFGALFGPKAMAKSAFGLASVGAGIGLFFSGFAVGDKTIAMMQADGEAIKPIIDVFVGLLDSLNKDGTLEAFAGVLGTSAIIGMFGGGAGAAIGLGAVGVGIGAFFAGIAAGDAGIQALSKLTGTEPGKGFGDMLKNIASGLGEFKNLEFPENLSANLDSITGALGQFFRSDFVKTINETLEPFQKAFLSTIDFFFNTSFAAESGKSPIQKLVESLNAFDQVDQAKLDRMGELSVKLNEVTNAFSGLTQLDNTKFARSMESAISGISFAADSIDGLTDGDLQGRKSIDPNDYFGGITFNNDIPFPSGGITAALERGEPEKVKAAINAIYDTMGVSRLSEAREAFQTVERSAVSAAERLSTVIAPSDNRSSVTTSNTVLNSGQVSAVNPSGR